MARGSSQSDLKSPRPSQRMEDVATRLYLANKAEYEKNTPGQRNDMFGRRDAAVKKNAFLRLASAIYQYEKYTHFSEPRHKERKQLIIDAVRAMPKEVQDLVLESNDKIKDLIRVATHASNPDEYGNISASFTADKDYIKSFKGSILPRSDRMHGRSSDYGDEAKTYSAKDIASFEGIISFQKINQLIEAYEDVHQLQQNRGTVAGEGFKMKPGAFETGLDEWLTFGSKAFVPRRFDDNDSASEHLVYGIKWKKGVT